MNVIILSDRLPTKSQLRLALSGVSYPITLSDLDIRIAPNPKDLQIVSEADVVLVTVPPGVNAGTQILSALRPRTSARIVAVGVVESPQQILHVLQSGADAFVDEAGDLHRQVKAELDRVVQQFREAAPSPEGSLIAVTGAVGGAGATLVAANLASMLSGSDQPCGIIDLSGGFGTLATLFGIEPRHSLSELCSNSDSLDLEMLKNSITEHSSGVQMIASGTVMSEWEFGSNEAIQRVVETACRLLPNVVIDLNRQAPFSQDLLAKCNVIVLMTTLDFPAAFSTQRLLEVWADHGIVAERIILVANRCRRKGELGASMIESMLGRPLACRMADDALSANLSVNCGNPAVLEAPTSLLSKDLRKLEAAVAECIAGNEAIAIAKHRTKNRTRKSVHALLKRVAAGFI